jgi:GH15 family glucan-1,4-alpha-glucosidase
MIAMTNDDGKLLQASALVLKAMEDKTHPGALIASLSIPWGDTRSADVYETGYRTVWPRDFYQCAMALLALGDTGTPVAAPDRGARAFRARARQGRERRRNYHSAAGCAPSGLRQGDRMLRQ